MKDMDKKQELAAKEQEGYQAKAQHAEYMSVSWNRIMLAESEAAEFRGQRVQEIYERYL